MPQNLSGVRIRPTSRCLIQRWGRCLSSWNGSRLRDPTECQFSGWNLYAVFFVSIAQIMHVSFLIAAVTAFQ